MKVAVIIPTLGRSFFVLNMLMLLSAGTRKPDEIIIVDQTDPENRNPWAWQQLRQYEHHGYCQIIEQPEKSLPVARNTGARASSADLLVFVDDDAFVPPDFLEAYIALEQTTQFDAATGMILISQADEGTIDTTRIHVSQHDGHTMLRGGNFAIRRSVMYAIGGMDENMVGAANHEDADLACRLHARDYKVVWAAKPWLYHLAHHEGGGRARNPQANVNFAYNLCYFYLRHRQLDWVSVARLLRLRVFDKQALKQPWWLPSRFADFVRGYRLARVAARRGPKLPLQPLDS